MNRSTFVYVTYIATTPEKLWEALTDGDVTVQYFFGTRVQSDWREGSAVTYSRDGAVTDYGNVLECVPLSRLAFTWTYAADKMDREQPSQVTFELHPMNGAVRLTLRHGLLLESDFVDDANTFEGFNNGWPAIISNLKSLLETGRTLPALSI